jgi:hypothetical protein
MGRARPGHDQGDKFAHVGAARGYASAGSDKTGSEEKKTQSPMTTRGSNHLVAEGEQYCLVTNDKRHARSAKGVMEVVEERKQGEGGDMKTYIQTLRGIPWPPLV